MPANAPSLAVREICAILRRLRDNAGLTDKQLAEQCGYGISQLNAIRNAKVVNPPPNEKIEKWVRACATNDGAATFALAEIRDLVALHEGQRDLEKIGGGPPYRDTRTGAGKESAPPRRVGVVPRRAARFQYRAAADLLKEAVGDGGTAVLCQVLAGMGGVGKTQLAADYAHQAWDTGSVDLLMWVTAASRDAIQTAYTAAAAEVAGADRSDPAAAAAALLAWLVSTDRRWLIVLDDLADPDDLIGLWPPDRPGGRVLVTTRRQDDALTGDRRRRVDVGLFTPPEATAYLTAALAGHSQPSETAEIAGLAEDLGYLPLALAQAAAYIIDSRHLDCAAYRSRLADRTRTLANLAPHSLPDDYRFAMAAAWSLSIERANQCRPVGLAGPLLELAAVLDPNGIPATVLTSAPALAYLTDHRVPADQTAVHPRPVDVGDARDALACLHLLSLVDYTPASPHQAVRVHQLIQRAVRETLPENRANVLARTAGDALLAVWPEVERDTTLGQVLRANTDTLHTVAPDPLWQPDLHPVLFRAATSLGNTGLVLAAADRYHHLATTAAQRLGPDHPNTLATRGNLAYWRGEAGDPAGAAAAADELLADRLRVLGPDHPDTLITRHNLAWWRGQVGDAAGAAAAFEQLLADHLRVLGPDHPETLTTRNNRAFWQGRAGNAAGAAGAFEALLAHQLRVLGPDHPHTLTTRNNLASWRGQAGDAAGAAAAFEALLADRLRVLGPDHPHTLTTRSNLARWRGQAGDAAGAAAAFEALLADRLRVLGPDHPDTLLARNHLAYWRGQAGDAAGAFEELLADQLRVLGPDHPHTLTTRGNLARWRGQAGDAAGAAAATEALLADQLRVLGPDHPDTQLTRNNLAHWWGEAGDAAGAAAAFEQLLADSLRVLGPDHPDTLITRNNLARWWGEAGDAAGAAAAFEALLADRLRVLGPDHPHTLATRGNLARWRERAGLSGNDRS
ncbi:helix-turn-helix transcriptional regulator [Frankia sp. AiPs1]|uniref:helix-turn-helix domain-containing protein n=1 Tax=Frankia sp. AiPs1 TaxID=573493 RepID=UPI00255AC8D6|nr:helix-turn-helix transcriptional regulator [Frankia sp. AiPs1]